MSETLPAHSPLGASGAERWMNCPGSISLLKRIHILDQSDDPDYRREGTACHAVVALCLENEQDAWEYAGREIEGVVIRPDMVPAMQTYLDDCRTGDPELCGVEQRVSHEAHSLFYGTVDRWELYKRRFVASSGAISREDLLKVKDYKNGAGIAVDVEWNPQLMYYAFGLLGLPDLRGVAEIELTIVQPNAFHHAGPVRRWTISRDKLEAWARDTLIPAMQRTASDTTLDAGPWCRFCPAKLVCPLLDGAYKAMATLPPDRVVELSDETLGRDYQLWQAVKMYGRALEEETLARAMHGRVIPGCKVVRKKANRVWNGDAEPVLVARFGAEKVYTAPALKSPPEIEKLGVEAKALVKQYAFTPTNDLTIAPETDPRVAVRIEKPEQRYAHFLKDQK